MSPQKYFLGVFIFFISVFVGSFFSVNPANAITSAQCESAGGTYSSKYVGSTQTPYCNFNLSAKNQIASYSNYNALSQCTRMGMWKTSISTANASTPSTWLGDANISVGYIVDADDGLRQCNNIIKGALDMWGYSGNYPEALQAFGYSKVDVPNCTGSGSTQTCNGKTSTWVRQTDTNKILQFFQTTIRERVYGGSAPTLEGKEELLYLRTQTHLETPNACNATPYKKVADLSAKEKPTYTNNDGAATSSSNPTGSKDYLIVKLVNGTTWKTEDWVYKLPKDNWIKIIKLNEAPSGGSVEYTCVKLAKDMAGYADRVAADAASMLAIGQDPSTKYAGIVVTPGGAGGTNAPGAGADTPGSEASSCTVEGVGWIVCPALGFMGGIVDGAYNFVSGLLVVQPLLTTGNTTGVYQAWLVMRNIANVAFVIAFLIIIFSQLTGVALSNYGVKKLLPRLVIAAILVNVSFWVCAIAIDLSNIIGASVVSIFDAVADNISTNLSGVVNDSGDFANGGQWTNIIGGVLAGGTVVGAVYYVGLAALIPALLAALVAIITVFLVLTLRQALIILLIVVSPLAFVAYLLPNTEDLFTKWRKLLTTLLLMYPIIAGIFGASALASKIIMQSSPGNFVVQIMGACIAILPLAITPLVMKTAGGLLNRFGGIVNNTERGPVDRLKKAGAAYGDTRKQLRNTRALEGGRGSTQGGRGAFVRWRARRSTIENGRKSEAGRANTEYIAKEIQNNANFQQSVAGGTLGRSASSGALQRAEASAISAQVKLEADEVNAASAIIKNANLDLNQMQKVAAGQSVQYKAADGTVKMLQNTQNSTLQTAAIHEQFKAGDIGMTDQLVSNSGSYGIKQRQAIAEGAQSLAGKVKYYGGITGSMIAQGEIKSETDLNMVVQSTVEAGKFSEQDLANQDKDALTRFSRIASLEGVDNSRLIKIAKDLQKNERIYPTVEDRKRDRIVQIGEGKAFNG